MRTGIKAAVLLGAFTALALPCAAAELKLKWQPGKRYIFESSSNSSTKLPLPGAGVMESNGKMTMRLNNDVKPFEGGVKVGYGFSAIKMRQEMQGIVMEFDSEDPAKGGGLIAQILKPLVDVKFDAVYDKKGALVEVTGLDKLQVAGQMGVGKAELRAMAEQSSQFLPKKAVVPGDTWSADVKMPMGSIGGDLALTYSFKFEEIVKKDDREVARISITGKMNDAVKEGGEEVLKVEAKKVSGTMLFDIELGQPLEISTAVEMEMTVPDALQGGAGAGKMPLKTLSVQKLIKIEDLPVSAADQSEPEGKKKAAGGELTPEEKKARRKARKEKRKAEKAKKEAAEQ